MFVLLLLLLLLLLFLNVWLYYKYCYCCCVSVFFSLDYVTNERQFFFLLRHVYRLCIS